MSFAPLGRSADIDPSFKSGFDLLNGFDEPQASAAWEPNAWVLLGVKVVAADQNDVWFVRLSTLEEPDAKEEFGVRKFKLPFGMGPVSPGMSFSAPVGRVLVESYDQHGNLMRSSVRLVPMGASNASLLDTCTYTNAGGGAGEQKPQVTRQNAAALMATLQVLGTSRALTPIRLAVRDREVFKKPSVLDLLLAGFRVNVEAPVAERELVQSPWSLEAALLPRHEAKFPVSVCGQTMFDCRVVVGPPNPPYNLLGGVLLFEAVHPDNADHRLTVRVLAAKRQNAKAALVKQSSEVEARDQGSGGGDQSEVSKPVRNAS